MLKNKMFQHELHVVIPGACGPLSDVCSLEDNDDVKRWINRLSLTQNYEKPLTDKHKPDSSNANNVIAEITGLKVDGDFPTGVLTSMANDAYDKTLYYMHADPVHLRADMDHAVLTTNEELAIDTTESAALLESLNQHFEPDGLRFISVDNHRWLLSSKNKINMSTTALLDSVGRNVNFILPEGEDARRWRQLLTEAQMLMYGHNVNESREQEGRLTINSVWFHGCGELADYDQNIRYRFCSDQDVLKGLAGHMGCNFLTRPKALETYLKFLQTDIAEGTKTCRDILYLAELETLVNYSDVRPWSKQLAETLNDWLYPLIAYTSKNNIKLIVHPCTSKQYHFSRYDFLKFWRKPFNNKLDRYIGSYGIGSYDVDSYSHDSHSQDSHRATQ